MDWPATKAAFLSSARPSADVHVAAESLPASWQSRDGEGAEQPGGQPLAADDATSQLLGSLVALRA